MTDRSNRREVRNPVLALPAMKHLMALHDDQRAILAEAMGELADDAKARAQHCWVKHKAPMAAYWKAVAVYAGHIRRAVKTKRADDTSQ